MPTSCNCDYSAAATTTPCRSCLNLANPAVTAEQTQRRIWQQVRVPTSLYVMNLAAFTSSARRLVNTNWHAMSDRVLAANQTVVIPSHGNSSRSTLTRARPGAASPGGRGVDVKHDSYARFLNRKKAGQSKTQTTTITPVQGNKTNTFGFKNCCQEN